MQATLNQYLARQTLYSDSSAGQSQRRRSGLLHSSDAANLFHCIIMVFGLNFYACILTLPAFRPLGIL